VKCTTIGLLSWDKVGQLFLHQMIPHHINAANTAKTLLKTNVLNCPDLSEDTDDCDLEGILRCIVYNQNYQIQLIVLRSGKGQLTMSLYT
jgi:hypothetical protein